MNANTSYEFTPEGVASAVYDAIRHCATHPRPDVLEGFQRALAAETQPRGCTVLR